MSRRKTYTSAEVKNRWNAQHYDRIVINVPQGGRDELQAMAAAAGMTVSAYVRALVIRDAAARGEQLPAIGGGAVATEWERRKAEVLAALAAM